MDVFEAFAKRYSYRGPFTDAPVPREDLEKIVQAGIQAPSGKNEQVVSFVIVDAPELLRQIAALVNRPVCNTARAMIACVADPRPVFEGFSFDREDCAAAVENMLLAITALGYASVWLDGVLRLEQRGPARWPAAGGARRQDRPRPPADRGGCRARRAEGETAAGEAGLVQPVRRAIGVVADHIRTIRTA